MGFNRDELDAKIAETRVLCWPMTTTLVRLLFRAHPTAVEAVMESVKSKRAVKLNVSGAFHSPLMADAAEEFNTVLAEVPFRDAKMPVMSNVDPSPQTAAAILKERLSQQMTGSVRWREISLNLPEQGIETVVEVGPGKVLTGLIKRTCKGLTLKNVDSVEAVNQA